MPAGSGPFGDRIRFTSIRTAAHRKLEKNHMLYMRRLPHHTTPRHATNLLSLDCSRVLAAKAKVGNGRILHDNAEVSCPLLQRISNVLRYRLYSGLWHRHGNHPHI